MKLIVEKHLLPDRSRIARSAVLLERDVGSPAKVMDHLQVFVAEVRLVCGDFTDPEVLGSFRDEGLEERAVVGVPRPDLYCRDDVGFDAAHRMSLDPILPRSRSPVLLVCPTDVAAHG